MEPSCEFNRVKVKAVRPWAAGNKAMDKAADKPTDAGTSRVAGGAPAGTAGAAVLPGIGRRVGNFVAAAGRTAVAAVKSGRWYRSEELARAVHGICTTANEAERSQGLTTCAWYRPDMDKCGHPKCGCNLKADALVSKTRWTGTRCPEGRWDETLKQEGILRK